MARKLWIIALVLALLAPAGLVAAGQHEGSPSGSEDEAAERRSGAPTGYEQNGTEFQGEHVAFTLDAGLPGIENLTVAPDATPVIAQVALPAGNEGEWSIEGPVFELESNESELEVWDRARAFLHVDVEEGGLATITLADGVNATLHPREADDDDDDGDDGENATDSDDDGDAIYRLQLADDRVFYLFGEGLEHDNGTFTVTDEATVAAFPVDMEEMREQAEDRMEDRREEARERMEAREGMRKARDHRAQFSEQNGTITGQYVSFQAGETGLQAYHLNVPNVTVFDTVELGPNATDRLRGASYEMRTDDARLQAIDQPHGMLVLQARDNATVLLTLDEGVTATLRAQDEATTDRDDDADEEEDEPIRSLYELSLPGNLTAMLAGQNLEQTGNGTFELTGQAQFRLRTLASHTYDHDDDDDEEEDEDRRGPPSDARARALDARASERVQEAIARGQVAVEVYADGQGGEPVAVELGHVSVRSAAAQAQGPIKAKVEIEAEDGSRGTSVVLNLNRADLGNLTVAQAASELAVRYDGENISAADNLEDALDWANDDGQPEYLLLVGGDQIQVFVSVPHFSPHTVEVYQAQTQSQDDANVENGETRGTPLPGLLATVAAGLAAAAVTSASRRND